MASGPSAEFDIDALYTAIDQARLAKGLSWSGVAREIKDQFRDMPATFSVSTLTGMRQRGSVEADGVLQMLLWLRRTPESFVSGNAKTGAEADSLPEVGTDRILRFDTAAIHAKLEIERDARGLTWREVADEIGGLNANSLRGMSKGGRTSFPKIMRILAWLGRPAASFTRSSTW